MSAGGLHGGRVFHLHHGHHHPVPQHHQRTATPTPAAANSAMALDAGGSGFGTGDGGGQDTAQLSVQVKANPTSQAVPIDFAKIDQVATVTFNVTTTFTPDNDDAAEHNGIHDLLFAFNPDGGTVVNGSVTSPGLTYDAASNDFTATAAGTDVLTPQTYTITVKVNYATRGVKHPALSGSATLTDGGSKYDGATQNVTLPAGTIDILQDGKAPLDATKKDSTGGFVQLNDDFDNGTSTPDSGKGQTAGEDNLLPIVLRASGAGGRYQLEFADSGAGQTIKVWAKPDKGAADAADHIVGGTGTGATYRIGTDQTIFDASVDTTLYVEGVRPSAAAEALKLRWKADPATAPYNVSDEVKLTVVNPDLIAKTVKDNAPGADLTGFDKQKTGAFVPVNNDDDDYADYVPAAAGMDAKTDKDQTGATTGKDDDLLPIVLHKVGGADAGNYRLTIPDNVKVWKKDDRTDAVDATTDIPANVDTTLYAEGLKVGGNDLKADWKNGTASFANADHVKVTTFGWSGALNVPGYGTYEYKATGALAGSKWFTPVSGKIKTGANTSDATILWDGANPVVGKAVYQVNDSYQWDLEVNVVQIKVEAPTSPGSVDFKPGVATDRGNPVYNGIERKYVGAGTGIVGGEGLKWTAKITVNGPDGDRGVSQIVVGFVQNGVDYVNVGTYTSGKTLTGNVSGHITAAMPVLDSLPGAEPWYSADTTALFDDATPAAKTKEITSSDGPYNGPPVTFQQHAAVQPGDDLLKEVNLSYGFVLDTCARTKETLNDADQVYTREATASWSFNGSGTINPMTLAWTAGAAAGIVKPSGWTPVTDGTRPKTSAPTFNTLIGAETFSNP